MYSYFLFREINMRNISQEKIFLKM